MKKILLILTTIVLLSSCGKTPISRQSSNNVNIEVDLLFIHDSIKMYRFVDEGRYHYFTKNMTITTKSCGKGCIYEEKIETK